MHAPLEHTKAGRRVRETRDPMREPSPPASLEGQPLCVVDQGNRQKKNRAVLPIAAHAKLFMLILLGTYGAAAAETRDTGIHVVEGVGCECCVKWTEYLRENGFTVTSETSFGTLLIQHKIDLGVPTSHQSCHTGQVEGYFLEGHVPADDIRRLLQERPDAAGLAVPGMPYGSPGMGPEAKREAYDVLLVRKDGSSEVFTSYSAAKQ